jgi:hypothetical protein
MNQQNIQLLLCTSKKEVLQSTSLYSLIHKLIQDDGSPIFRIQNIPLLHTTLFVCKSSRKTNFSFRAQLLHQMLTIWWKNQMPQGQVPGLRNIGYRLILTYDLISLPYALHSSFGLWLRKYLNNLPDIKFQTDWRLFKSRIQGIMPYLGFQTMESFRLWDSSNWEFKFYCAEFRVLHGWRVM